MKIKINTHKITILVMIFKLSQMGNGVDVRKKHHYIECKEKQRTQSKFCFVIIC